MGMNTFVINICFASPLFDFGIFIHTIETSLRLKLLDHFRECYERRKSVGLRGENGQEHITPKIMFSVGRLVSRAERNISTPRFSWALLCSCVALQIAALAGELEERTKWLESSWISILSWEGLSLYCMRQRV